MFMLTIFCDHDDEGDLYLRERQLTDSSCQLQMSNRSEPNATES